MSLHAEFAEHADADEEDDDFDVLGAGAPGGAVVAGWLPMGTSPLGFTNVGAGVLLGSGANGLPPAAQGYIVQDST
jgi:hypothetical protein